MKKIDHCLPVFKITGRVKWFNKLLGYGFILSDDEKEDIFLHYSCLKRSGYKYLEEGVKVECIIAQSSKGKIAVELIDVDPSTAQVMQEHNLDIQEQNSSWTPLKVKWFNRILGYGFLERDKDKKQFFIHNEILRKSGILRLKNNQSINAITEETDKGSQVLAVKLE